LSGRQEAYSIGGQFNGGVLHPASFSSLIPFRRCSTSHENRADCPNGPAICGFGVSITTFLPSLSAWTLPLSPSHRPHLRLHLRPRIGPGKFAVAITVSHRFSLAYVFSIDTSPTRLVYLAVFMSFATYSKVEPTKILILGANATNEVLLITICYFL